MRNEFEQYSVWPADRDLPRGWTAAGPEDLEASCELYIEKILTDLRGICPHGKPPEMQQQE